MATGPLPGALIYVPGDRRTRYIPRFVEVLPHARGKTLLYRARHKLGRPRRKNPLPLVYSSLYHQASVLVDTAGLLDFSDVRRSPTELNWVPVGSYRIKSYD